MDFCFHTNAMKQRFTISESDFVMFSHSFFYLLKFSFDINYEVTLIAFTAGAWRKRISINQTDESNIMFL